MLMLETFMEDFYLVRDIGWYSLKRESLVVFLKSAREWIVGFLSGFYFVTDFLSPSYSMILTPAEMPLLTSIVSIIVCALSLNIGASL